LVFWRDWANGEAAGTFLAVDVDTNERRALPMPRATYVSVGIEGSIVAAISREDEQTFLTVYDAASGRFLREREPLGPQAWLRAVGTRWLALDGPGPGGGLRVQPVEGGTFEPLGADGWLIDLDGDEAYLRGADGITRVHLPDGRAEALPGDWSLLSVHEGVQVHGRYSAPELHPLGRFWWLDEHKLLVGGALLWIVGVVALPTWLRWRRARG
ncbi:MAG TPA: hypothetical protein VM582_05915, partial [Candidatus Thermoplasmatota archaeon]|nr:hypothetical protein [Candidatus Thermoplasmatota archaeon]